MKTVYAVSIEDDSSGMVDWWPLREDAENAYTAALADENYAGNEINLFEAEVEDNANDDEVTSEVDAAMWDRDYTPIRWRKGTEHSALPHATPPTDGEG